MKTFRDYYDEVRAYTVEEKQSALIDFTVKYGTEAIHLRVIGNNMPNGHHHSSTMITCANIIASLAATYKLLDPKKVKLVDLGDDVSVRKVTLCSPLSFHRMIVSPEEVERVVQVPLTAMVATAAFLTDSMEAPFVAGGD
jgi:hypothetical protein